MMAASTPSFMRRLNDLPRDKCDTLLLVFSCVLVLLPFAEHNPLWLNLSAALVVAWRVWITLQGQAQPAKWLLTLITAVLVGGVYLHFHTWLGKDAGIAFLVILACLKMLEMHARRDGMAVVFVCYFLLIGQLLYSQSLLSAIYLLVCICVLVSTQLALQYQQMAPRFLTRFFSGFKVIGLAIPLALIFFLLFPRIQSPLWGKPGGSNATTGLSDSMEMGNVADLALSDQIAFRVKFNGIKPAPSQLYWRAVVLDKFDGRRWTTDAKSVPTVDSAPATGALLSQEIIMEPHNQTWLFGLDRPIGVTNSTAGNELRSFVTQHGEMRAGAPIQERIRYTITSDLNVPLAKNSPRPVSKLERLEAQEKSLPLPIGFNPMTLNWAQQLRQASNNPIELTNRVLSFFHEQPFRYTLSPPPLGVNQIDDFMFGTQAGFCEHYASAFVVIMRAMHIPARVVTGYQGGETNSVDGLLTVRQADAHAWAEIWIDQQGWIRVDPTAAVAPSRVERGIASSFPNRGIGNFLGLERQNWITNLGQQLRSRWDAVNSAWNLWALNYNLDKQKNLLSSITGIQNLQAADIGVAMMIAASFVVAILSLLLLNKKEPVSDLDKLYLRFCKRMENQGYPRLPNEGALDYAQRLSKALHHSQEINTFLALYSRCKYGKGYNSEQYQSLKNLLRLCMQLNIVPVSS